MTTLRVFALDALPDEPWRNGGGRTRTIATQPRDALANEATDGVPWDWRVSVATLEGDAAFSSFPGVDRITVLLCAGPVTLSIGDRPPHRLVRAGDLVRYPGDAPANATLHGAATTTTPPASVSLLNVMTRRDAARAQVRALSDGATLSAHALALLVIEGCWQVSEPGSLHAGDDSSASQPHTFDLSPGLGAWTGWAPTQPHRTGHLQLKRLSPEGMLMAIEIDSIHA